MIISRTPFRISFFGGGTDFEEFYSETYGAVFVMAVSSYMYVILNSKFEGDLRVVYSSMEHATTAASIKHGIFREGLQMMGVDTGVEVISVADAPGRGTGLGSSSALAIGLVNAVTNYLGRPLSREELASKAYEIEATRLQQPIGKQDQYATAYGGLNHIRFCEDESVVVTPMKISEKRIQELNDHLICVFTGLGRSANDFLARHKSAIPRKREILLEMRNQADAAQRLLESGDFEAFGKELDRAWSLKKKVSSNVTTPEIDKIYEKGRKAGAYGGKLNGAGGGGFLTLLCPKEKQTALLQTLGLRNINTALDKVGSCVIFPSQIL